MIETVQARSGRTVLRVDGKLSASAVDPEKEAAQWLDRRLDLLESVQSVIVLGIGSGYHIAELSRRSAARILVLENSVEMVDAAKKIRSFDPSQVAIEVLQSVHEVKACESVRACMAQSFVVLSYPPSIASNPKFYKAAQTLLIGRDRSSLNWQWKLKGFVPLDAQHVIRCDDEALTIYDLEQTELVQNSEERERMLIKALRELVK